MDITALFDLSYGMYIVSAKNGEKNVGCVANSIIQVSSSPPTLAVSLNRNNYTTDCIQRTGKFAVSILSENIPETVIGTFGFNSSRDKNKFADVAHVDSESGMPILNTGICAYIEGRVINQVDCHTHTIFIAEITDAQKISDAPPMTYKYYHKVIKGKTHKNSPTYTAEETKTGVIYTCDLCGYEYPNGREEFDKLPDSYVCPICSAPKSRFILK